MEQVFVVRRGDFFCGGDWPQGYHPLADGGTGLLDAFRRQGWFADRAKAEQEPQWKQIVPYCVVRRGAAVLCVQRKRTQSESRLHGLLSIGIGGQSVTLTFGEGGATVDPLVVTLRRGESYDGLPLPCPA